MSKLETFTELMGMLLFCACLPIIVIVFWLGRFFDWLGRVTCFTRFRRHAKVASWIARLRTQDEQSSRGFRGPTDLEHARSVSTLPNHPAAGSNAPGRCPLLGLPPELRLLIYEHLYDTECRITVLLAPDGASRLGVMAMKWAGPMDPYHFAWSHLRRTLLLTCRLVAKEAMPVLDDRIVFEVHVRSRRVPQASGCPEWTIDRSWFFTHLRRMSLVAVAHTPEDVEDVGAQIKMFVDELPASGKATLNIAEQDVPSGCGSALSLAQLRRLVST